MFQKLLILFYDISKGGVVNTQHFLLMLISGKQKLMIHSHVALLNLDTKEHHSRPTQNLSTKQVELFHDDISSHLAPYRDLLSTKIVWRNGPSHILNSRNSS